MRSWARCASAAAWRGGEVYEQAVAVRSGAGRILRLRQGVVRLEKPTRDGEREIRILRNLPAEVADAANVAELYRKRWRIETAFHTLSQALKAEIKTLSYPPVALMAFCVGLVSFNLFAVVKAALRRVHGEEIVEEQISTYYLADEIAGTYRGLRHSPRRRRKWEVLRELTSEEFASALRVGWDDHAGAVPKEQKRAEETAAAAAERSEAAARLDCPAARPAAPKILAPSKGCPAAPNPPQASLWLG